MGDPIVFKAGACPICGGDIMAEESMEGGSFTDGEHAFCASNCGWFGSVAVVEDGSDAFPSTASELEPIIERLEQWKERAEKAEAAVTRWQEREAMVCPEDQTFEETLQAALNDEAQARAEADALRAAAVALTDSWYHEAHRLSNSCDGHRGTYEPDVLRRCASALLRAAGVEVEG